jgi:hypothetical protein
MLASFISIGTSRPDDPGVGHDLPSLLAARRPHVKPIFQIKQSPERVRQKTSAPISNFLLRRCSVLAHPSCHFRVVCSGRDEFPQSFGVQATASKELAIHRTVIMVRAVPADEFCAAFIHQARSHGWKVDERSPRTSRSSSVQIERQRTKLFRVHSFRSNLQLLRKPRQNFGTRFGDQNHVFQSHAAQSRIVQARLNGHHLSIF